MMRGLAALELLHDGGRWATSELARRFAYATHAKDAQHVRTSDGRWVIAREGEAGVCRIYYAAQVAWYLTHMLAARHPDMVPMPQHLGDCADARDVTPELVNQNGWMVDTSHGAGDAPFKVCTLCGARHTMASWDDLAEGGEMLGMRTKNCDCGTTMADPRTPGEGADEHA